MTYLNTVRVLLKEPKVMLSMIRYAAGNMQNFTTRLGTHTRDDPLTEIPTMLQIWGKLKTRTFPREKAFLLTLLLGAVLFTVGVKKGSPYRDLSFLGLLALAGCFIDLFVAIFGDGKQELVKHLFLTNILFDMAAIFALNVITLAILELLAKGEHSKVVGNCRFWGLRAAYAARRPQNRQQPLSAPGKGKSDRIWQRPGKI